MTYLEACEECLSGRACFEWKEIYFADADSGTLSEHAAICVLGHEYLRHVLLNMITEYARLISVSRLPLYPQAFVRSVCYELLKKQDTKQPELDPVWIKIFEDYGEHYFRACAMLGVTSWHETLCRNARLETSAVPSADAAVYPDTPAKRFNRMLKVRRRYKREELKLCDGD